MTNTGTMPGPPKEPGCHLTVRQKRVLQLLGEGYTSRQIARQLGLSFIAVAEHLRAAYWKLEVDSRTQAIDKIQAEGLPGDPVPVGRPFPEGAAFTGLPGRNGRSRA